MSVTNPRCVSCAMWVWLAAALLASPVPVSAQHGEERRNTRLVGSHDLQARSAYQPLPVVQDDRVILYVGHHAGEMPNALTQAVEVNGTSVLDVTDPTSPVYLRHIPARAGAQGAQMAQVCAGTDLPGSEPGTFFLLRSNGNQSHELWDVTDPSAPDLVTTVATMGRTPDGQQHTHKTWWECESGIAYLVGTTDGWRAPRIVQVVDLSRPDNPRHIRDFSLDGVQPDAAGPIPGGSGVHEVVRLDDRLYVSYGTSQQGVFQILDRDRLLTGDPGAAARWPRARRRSAIPSWGGWICPRSGGPTPRSRCSTWRSTTTDRTGTRRSGTSSCSSPSRWPTSARRRGTPCRSST